MQGLIDQQDKCETNSDIWLLKLGGSSSTLLFIRTNSIMHTVGKQLQSYCSPNTQPLLNLNTSAHKIQNTN